MAAAALHVLGVVGKGVWGTCGQKRQGHRGHCGGVSLVCPPLWRGAWEDIFSLSSFTLNSGFWVK